jgi:phosphoserine phosphatase
MNGELAFEAALEERVALLAGVPESAVREICDHRLKLQPGARTLVRTMRASGATTLLVSGGFTLFTAYVAELAGFERHQGNRLELRDGRLTGRVLPPILGADAKLRSLEAAAAARGLGPAACLAVGDGANDRPMLEAAGLAVAFRPHPVLRAAADLSLDHASLEGALFLQGYAAAEFVR